VSGDSKKPCKRVGAWRRKPQEPWLLGRFKHRSAWWHQAWFTVCRQALWRYVSQLGHQKGSAPVWLVAVGLNTHVGGQGRVLLSGVAEGVANTVADPAGKSAECSHGGDLMEDPSSLKGPRQIATGRSTCSPPQPLRLIHYINQDQYRRCWWPCFWLRRLPDC